MEEMSKTSYVSPYYLATAYAGIGDKDKTFKLLNQAVDERSDSLILYITVCPEMDGVRGDPRYKDLLRRVNLPDKSL